MKDDKIARFWDNYIGKLKYYNIKRNTLRWYVKHAEHYIKNNKGLRLSQHTQQDLERYLKKQSQNPRIQDWQHKQIIRSLQVLFSDLLGLGWAKSFPWVERIDEIKTLPIEHASIAREGIGNIKKQLADKADNSSSLLAKVIKLYPKHIERVIVEIRMRQYSIRTEKAYSEWLAREIVPFKYWTLSRTFSSEPKCIW